MHVFVLWENYSNCRSPPYCYTIVSATVFLAMRGAVCDVVFFVFFRAIVDAIHQIIVLKTSKFTRCKTMACVYRFLPKQGALRFLLLELRRFLRS
jgi:hypothetical protein